MVFQVSLDGPDDASLSILAGIEPITEPIPQVSIQRAATEDQKTITRLFEQYNGRICTYLAHLVADSETGRDLAQETFLKAWKALPGLRDPALAEAWLFRIARNIAIDYLRRKKVRQIFLPWCASEGRELIGNSPIEGLEEVECIKQALARVHPKFRECLILYTIVGLSQKRIAEVLNIQESSVSAYVSFGRKEFRAAYEQLKGE